MALVTINGVGVVSGTVMRPLVGVPTADLVIDQADLSGFDPGTQVTITADGGYSFSGVVDPNRAASFLDAVHVRVLGGVGGMSKASSPRSYVQPGAFVRDVLNGLMADAGETLSSSTDAGLLATNLTAWSCIGGNMVARNLRALLDIVAPDMNWRILSDGTLWIGTETWPAASGTVEVLAHDPEDGSFHLGVDSPFITPGVSIDGVGNVSRVLDTIEAGHLRSRVWVDFADTQRGANAAVQQMARQALAAVDYHAMYVCQVASQSADLATVDVSPVGDRNKQLIGGLQRVPVRISAGIKVQFAPGATVLLGWDGGSPEGPYVACGLSTDGVIGMVLANGTNHAARVGDSTSGHVHVESGNAGPYPIVGSTQQATDVIAENGGKVRCG